MDATVAALLITLVIDIISKVRATRADQTNTKKTADAIQAMLTLGNEMRCLHNATNARLEMLERRMDFVEAATHSSAGRSGSWAKSH